MDYVCLCTGNTAISTTLYWNGRQKVMVTCFKRFLILSAGRVTGVAVTPSGDACVTCSTDKSARLFKVPFAPLEAGPVVRDVSAVLEFHGKYGFRSLDHHWRDNKFATGSEKV